MKAGGVEGAERGLREQSSPMSCPAGSAEVSRLVGLLTRMDTSSLSVGEVSRPRCRPGNPPIVVYTIGLAEADDAQNRKIPAAPLTPGGTRVFGTERSAEGNLRHDAELDWAII